MPRPRRSYLALAPTRILALSATLALLPAAPAPAQPPAAPAADRRDEPPPALNNASVSIPWREWAGLIDKARGAEPERPPVDYVFSEATYAATVVERQAAATGAAPAAMTAPAATGPIAAGEVSAVAHVTASVEVTPLGARKLALVPLGSAAGVTRVRVNGQPADLVTRDGGLFVLIPGGDAREKAADKGPGPNPDRARVELTLQRDVTLDRGAGRFEVPLIPSPIVTVTATVPGTGLEATAGGVLGEMSEKGGGRGGQTTFSATFRGGDTAVFSWKPRPPRVAPRPPRLEADTLTRVSVERGMLRCEAEVTFDVLHSGTDTFRLALPEGVEVRDVRGADLRDYAILAETREGAGGAASGGARQAARDGAARRVLVANVKERVKGRYVLTVEYERRLGPRAGLTPATAPPATSPATPTATPPAQAAGAVAVPLLNATDAAGETGSVGIEVPGGYEAVPDAEGASRVDVKELPQRLWANARAPILFGFVYDRPETNPDLNPAAGPRIVLSLTQPRDVAVLVAMSDVCEATTTYTPDGKCVTKLMYVLRNNLKQFMTLKLPEGAQIWSTFVDDRPVTPSRGREGDILIPLVKSEEEGRDADEDEDQPRSYRARRERRRGESADRAPTARRDRVKSIKMQRADEAPADLKPYDVEVVFVTPAVKFEERGIIRASLPQSDVPCGHLAWAIFLPARLQLVDVEGNLKEVSAFGLPFRHFGEAEYARRQKQRADQGQAEAAQQLQKAREAMQQAQAAASSKAEGVLPVRVEIPITGEIHRFEKFLTVDETPAVTLTYRKKAE